jgi:hypothetical protein
VLPLQLPPALLCDVAHDQACCLVLLKANIHIPAAHKQQQARKVGSAQQYALRTVMLCMSKLREAAASLHGLQNRLRCAH